MDADGVVAEAVVMVEIAEAARLMLADGAPFTDGEMAYARARSDPERRLAARLAAKRAAVDALGGAVTLGDVEVVRGLGGPPSLHLSERAQGRMRERGAARALVSLTHGRDHAAALVLLVAE